MSAPLAQRMRPQTIDDIVGQRHLLGEEVLDIGSISYLDIIGGNQTGYHRSILQSLW